MIKILTDIPGFEKGKLHCIDSSDNLAKVFLAASLIAELRRDYCTSVAYFSTRGTAKKIEELQEDHKDLVGALYAIDLTDNDLNGLCKAATELIEKKFVRAIVIDCLEGLDIKDFDGGVRAKRNEIKSDLNFFAASYKIPALLFCPDRKGHKYGNKELNPYESHILQQMKDNG